ncbi:MAG: peptidylprolyl isomerase [Thermoanaerobaculia bacterium]
MPERSGGYLLVVAVIAALIIAAVWWGLSRNAKKPGTPSTPVAAAKPAVDDPVILTVNGEDVRRSEFDAAAASIPEQMRVAIQGEGGKKALAEEIIRLKILEQEGKKLKVDEQPDVAAQVRLETANIMARATLPRLVAERGTKDIRQLYEENKARFEFVKARQIIVASEGSRLAEQTGKGMPLPQAMAKANDIAAKLRAGAKWEEMLKLSDDKQGAQQGGLIGEMPRNQTPEEIEKVLFALQPGQTSDAVSTPFGVHVFQVVERGTKSFDELKPALEQQGDKLRADVLIEQLRKSANVNFDPKFFGPAAK